VSLLLQAEEEELDQLHNVLAVFAEIPGPYDLESVLQLERANADLSHVLTVEGPVLRVNTVDDDVINKLVGKLLNRWIAPGIARNVDALETKTVLEDVEIAGLL
jgi:hypothetical protein